ncbi:MAG TPA: hypothetical protein VNN72_15805 [Polyangiaceae bacterium]|nr:hypothetical protein [Polyangiaceae bacterium]
MASRARRAPAQVLAALAALLACVVLVVPLVAGAQSRPSGLPAVISVGASGLDPGAIQRAVEAELHVPLVIDPNAGQRLELVVSGRRANVTYLSPGRDPVTRSVDLPKDEERALETLAYLVGNLARDEASELLAQLAPPPGEGATDVPPPPPPPPPPPAATGEAKPAPSAVAPNTAPPPVAGAAPKLNESKRFAANFSLYYPMTARKHTEQWKLNLEAGVAYSRVGAINGAAINLGYLRVDQSLDGFGGALFWTRTGDVRGIAGSFLVTEDYGRLKGIDFATIVNHREGNVEGLQASTFVATAGDVLGIEGAPIVVVGRDVQGFQGSVGVSVGRDIRGAQLGLVDVARDVVGVELGLVNAARDVQGAQLSLVNVGRRVKGLQLGLVNVSDELDGGAIGLVNIARNGRFQPVTWFSGPHAVFNVGYKCIAGLTYTQAGGGYDVVNDTGRWEVGAGVHLALPYGFYGEAGGGYAQIHNAKGSDSERQEVRYDLRMGFEPVHGVTPFVGGTLTQRVYGGGAVLRGEYAVGVSFL